MKILVAVLAGLFLPTIVSAQTVNVEGNVASQVDPDTSTVTASPTSLPANGVSTSVVTVTLRNSSSQTLPNIEVTLTSNRGAFDTIGHYEGSTLTPGNSYTSDANGVVRFGVRSSTVGSATVTAVAESLVTLDDKPVITFTSVGGGEELDPHPDLSTVTADPTSVPANGSTLTVITVTLRDKAEVVKPGWEVELVSSRGATDYIGHFIGDSLVDGNTYVSDANGVVKFGSRSVTPGEATYIATVTAIAVELTDKPIVTFTPTGPGGGGEEPPPPPPPGGEDQPPPTEEEETVIDKVIDFVKERANDATNKTLAGLGAITTIALFPTLTTSIITALLQHIPLLNFLLTSWLPIRKRRRWGTVRDRKTGVPVAGVQVELFKVGGSEPYLKYRTDQTGQYGFLVEETGDYFLSVTSPLYHDFKSSAFTLNEAGQIISMDIALSADEAEVAAQVKKARHYLDWAYYLNYFSIIMACVGTIVSIYVFYVEPTIVAGLILALYAVIWSVKLYFYIRYRYYGLVVDIRNNSPLPTSIIQLTGERQGIQALVHSTITDSRGRFLFIVKPAKYSMIVAKEGYDPAEKEVDEKRLAQTIQLRPSANDEMLNRPAPQPTI